MAELVLILGGANSGKSDFAESLVRFHKKSMTYIATAQAFDAEMAAKIAQHTIARGDAWTTIEAPHDAPQVLGGLPKDGVALLDCATMWLSNRMLNEADLEAETELFLAGLQACPCPLVVVSNEIGMGIVPDNALARRFRSAQGRLNRQIAARAGLVVQVTAGLPLVLKGALPQGFA